MSRTNAKRRRKQSKSARSKTGASPKLVIVTLIFIGIFIAFLVFLNKQPVSNKSAASISKSSNKKPKPVAKQTNAKPKFDFYDMLQDKPVSAPPALRKPKPSASANTTTSSSSPASAPSPAAPADKTSFILQVASLQNASDADRLRAQLTLLGYNVNIQPFNKDGKTWNRVIVGPYDSKRRAERDRSSLRAQHIDSLLLTNKTS